MVEKGSRPFGVTLVFVVILLTGAFIVFAGFMRLFTEADNTDVPLVAALVTIALGLIYLLIAKGIANGSRMARFIVALVTVLSVGSAIWMLVIAPGLWLTLVVQIVLGLIVLALLYSARSRQFFGS
ncbi:MAG: hypothetical protein IPO93_14675 [Actinobacteria bacterium]|jgi:hypothetical protein|nr:hypothetical protein [Actinomycetota bacterium]